MRHFPVFSALSASGAQRAVQTIGERKAEPAENAAAAVALTEGWRAPGKQDNPRGCLSKAAAGRQKSGATERKPSAANPSQGLRDPAGCGLPPGPAHGGTDR